MFMMNPEVMAKKELCKKINLLLTPEEREKWDQAFVLSYVHHTTAIDGNRIDENGVRTILEDGVVSANTTLVDLEELQNAKESFQFIEFLNFKKVPLTESLIKDINEKTLPRSGGIYRDHNVFLRGEGLHVPPSFEKVRPKMKDFVVDIGLKSEGNPIEQAAWIHAEFTKIHPFPDNNGQTGRLLMNYILLENDLLPIILTKEDKNEYFKTLDQYSTEKNITPFAEFVRKNLLDQMGCFIQKFDYYLNQN